MRVLFTGNRYVILQEQCVYKVIKMGNNMKVNLLIKLIKGVMNLWLLV